MLLLKKARRGFVHWLARRLPPCKEIAPLASASLDRKLRLRERLALRLHLMICAGCRRYLSQLVFLRAVFHRHAGHLDADRLDADHLEAKQPANGSPAEDAALSPEARARIHRTLCGE